MITSVMSIHAKHRFTQGFRILCKDGSGWGLKEKRLK
jgi:hypothetical protein